MHSQPSVFSNLQGLLKKRWDAPAHATHRSARRNVHNPGNNDLQTVVADYAELQRKNFSTEVEAAVLRRPLEQRIQALEKENEDLRRKLDGWVERWVTVEYNARLLGKDADKLFEPIQPPQRKTLAFRKEGKGRG